MHSVCWAKAPHDSATATRRRLLLTARSLHHPDGAREAAHSWHQAVSLLLQADATAAPSLHGAHLALALAQQLAGHGKPPRVLVLTCGVLAVGGDAPPSDAAAHGGAWGFARVLRLEQPALRTQSADVCWRGMSTAAPPLLAGAPTAEAEAAWRAFECVAARLRACSAQSATSTALAHGVYAITGGLGGLGLRAATLLVERSASHLILGSRSGRVVRDGKDLDAQLQPMATVAVVVAGDSADAWNVRALWCARLLAGVLLAAGAGDAGLVVELAAQRVRWMYASKAMGAWYLLCAAAAAPLETRVLWSSVGSGCGRPRCSSNAARLT